MDNNQPKRNRRKAEPTIETPAVEETPTNKYAPKEKIGTAKLGRSSNDNSNVQSE